MGRSRRGNKKIAAAEPRGADAARPAPSPSSDGPKPSSDPDRPTPSDDGPRPSSDPPRPSDGGPGATGPEAPSPTPKKKRNRSNRRAKKGRPAPPAEPTEGKPVADGDGRPSTPAGPEDGVAAPVVVRRDEGLTLETLEAISDEDSEDGGKGPSYLVRSEEDSDEDGERDKEARALKQAIADGAFDHLAKLKKSDEGEAAEEEAEVEGEEAEDEAEDEAETEETPPAKAPDDAEAGSEDETSRTPSPSRNAAALLSAAEKLTAALDGLHWMERTQVVSSAPLPFGGSDGAEGSPLDVHDDLKREVAFYDAALDAVGKARAEYKRFDVPFSRPDDFFAEMVKTDDHMADVKDRLIFESKKMDAFERRKSEREQKLRQKEKRASRTEQKALLKRNHLKDVDDWAKSAAANRPSGGMVRDDDEDERMAGLVGKKRRAAADRKYGFGGKSGRFKQMDKAMINDMSKFNYKGNFGGLGTRQSNKSKNGSGANRKGKRARDAAKR